MKKIRVTLCENAAGALYIIMYIRKMSYVKSVKAIQQLLTQQNPSVKRKKKR